VLDVVRGTAAVLGVQSVEIGQRLGPAERRKASPRRTALLRSTAALAIKEGPLD